jgi:hypothetical protein
MLNLTLRLRFDAALLGERQGAQMSRLILPAQAWMLAKASAMRCGAFGRAYIRFM